MIYHIVKIRADYVYSVKFHILSSVIAPTVRADLSIKP